MAEDFYPCGDNRSDTDIELMTGPPGDKGRELRPEIHGDPDKWSRSIILVMVPASWFRTLVRDEPSPGRVMVTSSGRI